MRIAQVAPLYESVPPTLYGGTERIVSYLTEELVRLGHDVTLFASGDSITTAKLRAPCERALRLDPSCQDSLAPHVRMLGWVYGAAKSFDVIHAHTDYLGLPLARSSPAPTVITLHGRLDIPEPMPLFADYPEVSLVSISNAQRVHRPDSNWAATVYHGIPLDLYDLNPTPDDYLLFLGRISPEKKPDAAAQVAIAAGVPLRIAAKVDKSDREYYESIRHVFDHPLIDFRGEVGDQDKRDLLGRARALIFPIDWPEPFGLVMIEALACGTPVIVRRRGSAPEVVRHGETGFVCETEDEMIAAVKRLPEIDRVACRADFERRFTSARMARDYIAVYERIVAQNANGRQRHPTRRSAHRPLAPHEHHSLRRESK